MKNNFYKLKKLIYISYKFKKLCFNIVLLTKIYQQYIYFKNFPNHKENLIRIYQ